MYRAALLAGLLFLFGSCFPRCFTLLVRDFVRLLADSFPIRFFLGWIVSHIASTLGLPSPVQNQAVS
jgi:hypothetical protein